MERREEVGTWKLPVRFMGKGSWWGTYSKLSSLFKITRNMSVGNEDQACSLKFQILQVRPSHSKTDFIAIHTSSYLAVSYGSDSVMGRNFCIPHPFYQKAFAFSSRSPIPLTARALWCPPEVASSMWTKVPPEVNTLRTKPRISGRRMLNAPHIPWHVTLV